MPEGDTIYRTAATLRTVLAGQQVIAASGAALGGAGREGKLVTSVEPRGKHLLIRFDDEKILHSHMGMTGSWHIYRNGDAWQKNRENANCIVQVEGACAACYSPKVIELISNRELECHPYLAKLGPDLMAPDFDFAAAVTRFRVHHAQPIGEAVMNQTIVCGMGNVYKSELLFIERINPFTTVGSLSDYRITSLLKRSRKLLLRNRIGHRRTTRVSRQGSRVWVYGRSNERCFKCDSTIEMRRQGDLGRSTYWCPVCQVAS